MARTTRKRRGLLTSHLVRRPTAWEEPPPPRYSHLPQIALPAAIFRWASQGPLRAAEVGRQNALLRWSKHNAEARAEIMKAVRAGKEAKRDALTHPKRHDVLTDGPAVARACGQDRQGRDRV